MKKLLAKGPSRHQMLSASWSQAGLWMSQGDGKHHEWEKMREGEQEGTRKLKGREET